MVRTSGCNRSSEREKEKTSLAGVEMLKGGIRLKTEEELHVNSYIPDNVSLIELGNQGSQECLPGQR